MVALLVGALAACSGNTSSNATGGAAGMMAAGGSAGGANAGGAKSNGGTVGTASGGALGPTGGSVSSAGGGAGSVDLTSDPGSGTCTNFTPCGGDVLGTWNVESLCLDSIPVTGIGCSAATTSVTIAGSLTFKSDGTYIPRGSSTSRITLPASCASICTASCTTTSDGGCTCEATTPLDETPLQYSVNGTKLLVQPRADTMQTAYYCRNGSQLLMRGYSTAGTRYEYNLKLSP